MCFTLTLSVTILSHEIERTPGKTVGISHGNQTHFKYFPAQVFSSVFLCRYVERVCEVVDTSNATMVNSPEKKDVS